MKFVFYTNVISPHQLPMAQEIIGLLGEDNYRYIYTDAMSKERAKLGWAEKREKWAVLMAEQKEAAEQWLEAAEVLMSENREVDLFKKRLAQGKTTIYSSERWFKPRLGILRLLKPSYFKMARTLVGLLRTSEQMFYFPQGIHAARDMVRLCGLMSGDLRCLFKAPELEFERKPGGRIWLAQRRRGAEKYCLDKMRMFCYTVAPSAALPVEQAPARPNEVRVLWVGRLLDWKRVDTIVRAVSEHADLKRVDTILPKITLDIYGSGPMEAKLKAMARGYEDVIKFYPPVPIAEVRKLMREHDVYVLASNGYEGWGAVVSEALEEGMRVIGTYEAGSSATILPERQLFHFGDAKRLRELLNAATAEQTGIGEWSAKKAAERLVSFAGGAQ